MSVRNVLVTDGEQRSALAVVRSLGRAGYRPYVCSRYPRSMAGASRFAVRQAAVPDALRDPPGFTAALAERVAKWQIDILIPVTDASCVAVLADRDRLNVEVPLPAETTFRAVSDKLSVLDRARSFGIAVPRQQVLTSPDDVADPESSDVGFPLVVKPARSVSEAEDGGLTKLGVVRASDATQLRRILATLPASAYPLMLQQSIRGPGVGVFLLRWGEKTLAEFSHRRLREKPPGGGVSVYRESIPLDRDLADRSSALLDSYEWKGVAMVEYKVSAESGEAYLMEVNGRFWGSLQLAIDAGVDFPRLLAEAMAGQNPKTVSEYRTGIRSRWWWGDVDHLLTRLRRSDEYLGLDETAPSRAGAAADFLKLWRAGDRSEVFRLSDPAPFLRETAGWLRGR